MSRFGSSTSVGKDRLSSPKVPVFGVGHNVRALANPAFEQEEHRRFGNEAHGCTNEIVVYKSPKFSFHKSFDAHTSFVRFSEHGVRTSIVANELTRGNSARNLSEGNWYESRTVSVIRKVLENPLFQVANVIAISAALFLPDLFLFLQVPDNIVLDTVLTTVLTIFTMEFIGLSIADSNYTWSFHFWADMFGTVSIIFDMSYILGPTATLPAEFAASRGGTEVARPAFMDGVRRLCARGGQLLRVMRLVRIVRMSMEEQGKHLRVASAISIRLAEVIPTRVAVSTVCLDLLLYARSVYRYGHDESMLAWVHSLAADALEYRQALGDGASSAASAAAVEVAAKRLNRELRRLVDFYEDSSYGPFSVCLGHVDGKDGSFICEEKGAMMMQFNPVFEEPSRPASAAMYYQGNFQIGFNLTEPHKFDAARNMIFLGISIAVVGIFSRIMYLHICGIALAPMERVLDLVRQRVDEIFQYTNYLRDTDMDDEESTTDEKTDDVEKATASEFHLLETALTKLAAIATLSQAKGPVGLGEDEENTEEAMMILNWIGEMRSESSGRRSSSRMVRVGQTAMDSTISIRPSQLVKGVSESVVATIKTSHFDAFNVPVDQQSSLACFIIITSEGCSEWIHEIVDQKTLLNFMYAAQKVYLPVPFHNFSHALDTVYSVSHFMSLSGADCFLAEVDTFWLLLAAAGHDLGHLGVDNGFLIETGHELALTYNDRSPLENMHCSKLFDLIRQPEFNVFKNVERDVYKETRKGMVEAILHTDITKHSEMMKETNLLFNLNAAAFREQATSNELLSSKAQFVANLLLHCADVSNPMKPWELCQKIAHLVLDEFFAQGDKEKEKGIPVQMLNDREKVNRPNSQVGFMEFMLLPMVESVVLMLPALHGLSTNLANNIQHWSQVWEEEEKPTEEALEKVRQRVQKVVSRCQAVLNVRQNYESGSHGEH